MPPVMGAGAFIMADITGISYLKICAAAAIPACLYYIGLAFAVHMEARKLGFSPISRENLPLMIEVLKKGAHFLVVIFALLYFLVAGNSPEGSCFKALLILVALNILKNANHLSLKFIRESIIEPLVDGSEKAVMVVMACACVGIVVGCVTMTGVGSAFSELVTKAMEINLLFALVCVMLASLLLGMGLPTVAAYLLLVIVTAPALVGIGIPLLAAHLFVFYFGCMAPITPPVALAAYAGAGIAGADPFKTGYTATRLGIVAFIVPFMFIYGEPLILIGSTFEIIIATITAILGVFILAIGNIGFFIRKLNFMERILAIIASFCLIKPGYITDLIGIILMTLVLGRQMIETVKKKKEKGLLRRSGEN